MDLKLEAAARAIELIKNKSTIGLGAGSTMAHMVNMLKVAKDGGLEVKVLTSSFSTGKLLRQNTFDVQDTASTAHIDQYFDGCDQFDKHLNALKSGGGIHTMEKILAVMAKEFIIVGDESKYTDELDNRFPLVIEVLPAAMSFVPVAVLATFPGVKADLRMSVKKDGAVVTENGNYLFDLWFAEWADLSAINPSLKNIPGVVETSLFYNIARKAIIAGKEGVRIIEKD